MLNPYKRVSVRYENGSKRGYEIKPFETIAQAREYAKDLAKLNRANVAVIVNETVWELYDSKGKWVF